MTNHISKYLLKRQIFFQLFFFKYVSLFIFIFIWSISISQQGPEGGLPAKGDHNSYWFGINSLEAHNIIKKDNIFYYYCYYHYLIFIYVASTAWKHVTWSRKMVTFIITIIIIIWLLYMWHLIDHQLEVHDMTKKNNTFDLILPADDQ